jgi:Ca-activated chloride channel family protein
MGMHIYTIGERMWRRDMRSPFRLCRRIVLLTALAAALSPAAAHAELYRGLMQKGFRFYRRELYREAAEYFDRAAIRNERALEPYFNGADAYYKNMQYQKSIDSLETAKEHTDDPAQLADIHYNLGNAHFKLGDYQSAIDSYMKGLAYDPHDLNMKYNLELALKKRDEQQRAKEQEKTGKGDIAREGSRDQQAGGDEERATNTPMNKQNQEGSQQEKKKGEFSQEEARRLIDSINNRQTTTLGDIIRGRIGESEDENDW